MTLTSPDAVAARAALRTQLPPGLLAGAVVDLDAVAGNVAVLREHAPGAQLMAVVKADGYGHGMVPVARDALAGGAGRVGEGHGRAPGAGAALAGGADRLGVAHLREALELRAAGVDAPILAWLTVPG